MSSSILEILEKASKEQSKVRKKRKKINHDTEKKKQSVNPDRK